MQCPICKAVIGGGQKYCKICAFDLTQGDFSSAQTFQQNAPNFSEMPSRTPVNPNLSAAELFTVGAPPANNFSANSLKITLGIGLGIFVLIMGVLMLVLIKFQMNSGSLGGADLSSKNTSISVNRPKNSVSNSSTSSPAVTSKSVVQKNGRLITDLNIRDAPNKEAWSRGIHFMNAKVRVLEETSYELEGKVSTWYRVQITEFGCSKDASLGCGKNSPNDSDEGWVNAKYILLD
jgi:hypothetical protein